MADQNQPSHHWCQLSAAPVGASEKTVVVDHSARIEDLSRLVQDLHRRQDNQETPHTHADLDTKIQTVHETMAEVVKNSLATQRCTQEKAHAELKAAFSEVTGRLEAVKTGAKSDHDLIIDLQTQLSGVASMVEFQREAIASLEDTPAPVPVVIHPDAKPVPIWPLVVLIVLWCLDIALRFVPIK